MELKRLFEKINKPTLMKALASDDPKELQDLLEKEGIDLSDEQLDYIAGGICSQENSNDSSVMSD